MSHSGSSYYEGVRAVERRNITTDLVATLEEAVPELRRLERSWAARGVALYSLDLKRHRELAERLLRILRQAR